jgi:hypothetical protein
MGGLVAARDPALIDRLRRLQNYGWSTSQYSGLPNGRGSRLDAGAGLAGKHDTIEQQRFVAVRQRPAMEGGHHRIERLGDLAHREGLTLRPSKPRSVSPTLRVKRPSTKPARMNRSIFRVRRA